jgi:hypothetical protein
MPTSARVSQWCEYDFSPGERPVCCQPRTGWRSAPAEGALSDVGLRIPMSHPVDALFALVPRTRRKKAWLVLFQFSVSVVRFPCLSDVFLNNYLSENG